MNGNYTAIRIRNFEIVALLIILSIITLIEVKVTISRPIAFGDEGFHVGLGRFIGLNKEYPVYVPLAETNTAKVGFNRAPLWNILEGSFYMLFGSQEIIVKLLVPFLGFLTGLSVYLIVKKILNPTTGFISSLISITIPSYVTYAVLFYAEILLTFFFGLAILLTILTYKTGKRRYLILVGVFAAFAILTKDSGYFILPFFFLCFIYDLFKKRNFIEPLKRYVPIIVIILLITIPFFLRNYAYYKTPSCDLPFFNKENCSLVEKYTPKYSFTSDIPRTGTGAGLLQMGIVSYLNFAYGFLWFVPFVFLSGIIILLSKREDIHVIILFAILVFLYAFYFTVNGRSEDIARHTLGMASLIGLIGGIYFNELVEALKKYFKYIFLIFIIIVVIASFFNFMMKLNTMKEVKRFSPSFFEMCNFIKENTPKNSSFMILYVSPFVYNCERKASWEVPDKPDIVLSNDINLVLERLKANGFTHVIVQKFALSGEKYSSMYPVEFVRFLMNNPEEFKNIYENGPQIEQCIQAGGCDGSVVYEVNYVN